MTVFQRFIGVFLVSAVALPGLANMPPPSLHRANAVHPPRTVTPLSDKHIVFDTCTLERADGASCTVEAGCNCGCLCVGNRTYKNPELAIVCRASGVETARIPVLLPAISHMGLDAQGCGFVVGGTKINRSMQGLHGKSMADIFTPYTGFLGAVSPGIVNVQGGAFKNEAGVGLNIMSLEYGVQLPGVRAGRGKTELMLNPRGTFNLPGNFVEAMRAAALSDQQTYQQMEATKLAIIQAGDNQTAVQQLAERLKTFEQQGSAVMALLKGYVFQSTREPALPVTQMEQAAGVGLGTGDTQPAPVVEVVQNIPQVEETTPPPSPVAMDSAVVSTPQSVRTVQPDNRGEWVRAVPRRRVHSAPPYGPIVRLNP